MGGLDNIFNHPWVAAERKKITDRIEEKYRKKKPEKKVDNQEKLKQWLNEK